jgi:hypothetical protein
LCVDSTEPKKIASFWEAALGWSQTFDEDDQVCTEPPKGSPEDGVAPDIMFLKVPDSTRSGFQRTSPAQLSGSGSLRLRGQLDGGGSDAP